MPNPTVSFIVPCYKLAHLLPECINSILSQTFEDLEVLIMDDCSPDNTADVARSFTDPRVKHIRNEPNLGHLRNYNKGISLARGKYVWLISADDYLRKNYVLERYITLAEQYPKVGFAFCSGVSVKGGKEAGLLPDSVYAARDAVVPGHTLLRKLLRSNFILAASGLVRRECYQKLGAFPLNMPWNGDWYMWCLFSLHYDAAFFAEPMVAYRQHELSMTNELWTEDVKGCIDQDIGIPWAIKRLADAGGLQDLSRECLNAAAEIYARRIAARLYGMARSCLTLEQFEDSLCQNIAGAKEREYVRARVHAGVGNEYYWQGDPVLARQFYLAALKKDPWMANVYAKIFVLSLGKLGTHVRRIVRSFRSRGISK